ncbi:hypothetical protein [Chitinophaga alhagiae]|uniref:hypothetical protein n=1 Tax=Chitinophaga alhagiae TaxID=2203219 RepID=UPI001300423F|nr:hypothetical protein [Chitinophaga alhagiae]
MYLRKKRRHVMNDADIAELRTENCPFLLQARKEARDFLEKHPLPPEFLNRRPLRVAEVQECTATGSQEKN